MAVGAERFLSEIRTTANLQHPHILPLFDSGAASGKPTGAAEAVIATTRVESRGAWSPDGQSIAFNSDQLGDMNLWLHSADGSDRQLTRGPGGDYQPNWAPDGKTIAFFSSREGQNDIWSVDVADGAIGTGVFNSG